MVENTKDLGPFHFIFFYMILYIEFESKELEEVRKLVVREKCTLFCLSCSKSHPHLGLCIPSSNMSELMTLIKNKFYAFLWSPCNLLPKSKYSLEKEGNESVSLLNTFSCFCQPSS